MAQQAWFAQRPASEDAWFAQAKPAPSANPSRSTTQLVSAPPPELKAAEQRRAKGLAHEQTQKAKQRAEKADKAREWRELQAMEAWQKKERADSDADLKQLSQHRSRAAGLRLQQLSRQRLKGLDVGSSTSEYAATNGATSPEQPRPASPESPPEHSAVRRPRTAAFRRLRAAKIATRDVVSSCGAEAESGGSSAAEIEQMEQRERDAVQAQASLQAKREAAIAQKEVARVERARTAALAYAAEWAGSKQQQQQAVDDGHAAQLEQRAAAAAVKASKSKQQQQQQEQRDLANAKRIAARNKRLSLAL